MSAPSSVPVRDAIILAAGNGDRFKNSRHHSKLLHPVLGQPLILRTLQTAVAAGITNLNVVLGFEAGRVRDTIERGGVRGATIRYAHNPDWHLENGISALSARELCGDRRFALLMGDHLFESPVLHHLAHLDVDAGDSLLGVDSSDVDPAIAEEATKVRMADDRIVAIGKTLPEWDALDTGMFVFTPALFEALEEARRAGETTLSAGVQRLAERGLMRGVEIGAASWCDIDTVADLQMAESLFAAAEPEHA